MPWPKRPMEERFWRNIQPDTNGGCWLWAGSLNSKGYGQIVKDGARAGTLAAHRVSWEIHNGQIPEGDGYHGWCVCHRCDVPSCVNPAHLFLGTASDNTMDCSSKGRMRVQSGELNARAKLTAKDVREIKEFYTAGVDRLSLARRFGISRGHLSDILTKRRWGHLADTEHIGT